MQRSKYISAIFFGVLIVFGLALHLYRISYPATPVFDEAHFATYAADYITGTPFFDIHPPLGKLIYAAALLFYPRSTLHNAPFVKLVASPGQFSYVFESGTGGAYGDFPYIALRVVSAIFGILLPLALYFFMRNIGAGRIASFLAATFLLFDNAVLLNTRLILMDGMFLLFSLIALAFYFHRSRPWVLAGIFFGLALSVKLTAIVFIGPAFLACLLSSDALRIKERILFSRTMILAFAVLVAIVFAGTFVFSPAERLGALSAFHFSRLGDSASSSEWIARYPVAAYFAADATEAAFSLGSYVAGAPHDGESPWYFWSAAQIPLVYYMGSSSSGGPLVLAGNIVVWLGSTLAVILALVFSVRYLSEHRRKLGPGRSPPLLLLGGYIFCTLPFVLVVERSTFLYHYFPALIFAIGLLGWFVAKLLRAEDWSDLTAQKTFLLLMIMFVVIAGFLAVAPVTYGL